MSPSAVRRVAAVLALVGLLIEIRGVYITASMFQPFQFTVFLRHVPKFLWAALFRFRPDLVLSETYLAAVKLKGKLVGRLEGAYFAAGLGLLVVGISLQVIAAAMMLWLEFESAPSPSPNR